MFLADDWKLLLIHTFNLNLLNKFPSLYSTTSILIIHLFTVNLTIVFWMNQEILYSVHKKELISCVLKGKKCSEVMLDHLEHVLMHKLLHTQRHFAAPCTHPEGSLELPCSFLPMHSDIAWSMHHMQQKIAMHFGHWQEQASGKNRKQTINLQNV